MGENPWMELKKEENPWIIEVNENVKGLSDFERAQKTAWDRHSIYKLPASLTDLVPDRKKNAYKPQTVSLGPYHHDELNLRPMEVHKERALLHFLHRSKKPLKDYVEALGDVVQDLKDSYDSLEDEWQKNSGKFLKLMIRDGCFMLELLRTTESDYADNDPVFGKHGQKNMVPYIRSDMLMLENQLPMLLLRKLHDVYRQNLANEASNISPLIREFFLPDGPDINLENCKHVLDAHRQLLCNKSDGSSSRVNQETCSCEGDDEILSVVKLEQSGIQIKKSESRSLSDIKFDRGILWLPQITVDDDSETMFLNLLAFERLHAGAGYEVTCYVHFMDRLIDNSKDVDILQSLEIISNDIGSNEVLANLFNSLLKDVVIPSDRGSFTKVGRKINSYCKTKCHKWRASFCHTYCINPWVITSVIAAILLFALTIFQAVFGALQYYKG